MVIKGQNVSAWNNRVVKPLIIISNVRIRLEHNTIQSFVINNQVTTCRNNNDGRNSR